MSIYDDDYDVTTQTPGELAGVLAMVLPMRAPTELEMVRVGEVLAEFERRVHLGCGSEYDCHGGAYACFYGARGRT